MIILVVSDNHGDRNVLEQILAKEKFDLAVHLGDSELSEEWIGSHFQYYVSGNHETYSPTELVFEADGIKFAICHGHLIGISVWNSDGPAYSFGHRNHADVVLHGHTHIFKDHNVKGMRIICPGSTSYSRGKEGNGYCIIKTNHQKIFSVDFKGVY